MWKEHRLKLLQGYVFFYSIRLLQSTSGLRFSLLFLHHCFFMFHTKYTIETHGPSCLDVLFFGYDVVYVLNVLPLAPGSTSFYPPAGTLLFSRKTHQHPCDNCSWFFFSYWAFLGPPICQTSILPLSYRSSSVLHVSFA
jgi:hypothetical protein